GGEELQGRGAGRHVRQLGQVVEREPRAALDVVPYDEAREIPAGIAERAPLVDPPRDERQREAREREREHAHAAPARRGQRRGRGEQRGQPEHVGAEAPRDAEQQAEEERTLRRAPSARAANAPMSPKVNGSSVNGPTARCCASGSSRKASPATAPAA